MSRVFFVSADGEEIRLETPLSVGPLHYLVEPTDKLENVQIFDEPRRLRYVDTYAQTIVNDINNPANMRSASSYFKRIHDIEKPDVLNAFTDFNKKFLDLAKRTSNVEKMKPSFITENFR